jgi:hypothetical protein
MANKETELTQDRQVAKRTTGQKEPGVFIPKPQPTGPTPEKEPVAGPLARGLQSALIGQAFESFGKSFTGGGYTPVGQAQREPAGMQNWRNAGNQVQVALEQRWYQAEFKNFRNAELKEFQSSMQGLINESKFMNKELDRGIWHEAGIEGDGAVTRLDLTKEADRLQQVQLRGQLQSDMIQRMGEMQVNLGNSAAEKYRTNPLIGKMIAEMYKHTSQSLMTQFNPAAALKTAESMSGLRKTEAEIRSLDASARASDASASASRDKQPEGLHEAYKQGGAALLDAFINGTDQGLGLWEQVKAGYETELEEEFARNWRKTTGKNVTINAKQKMEADFKNSQDKLRRVAQYRWVRDTLGQKVADELQKQNPGYGPDPVTPQKPAVIGAVSPEEGKKKADKFAGIALDRYNEWMGEQDPNTTMEQGIDFILKEWLPRALDGDVPNHEVHGEYILDNLTAGTGKASEAYRSLVRARVADQLRAKAGTGKGGKRLQKHQKATPRVSPKGGGLVRSVKSLFGDEDVYAEKAPKLPPEPGI